MKIQFTDEDLIGALTACTNKKGDRCSQCPIFGKGYAGICTSIVMQHAVKRLKELTDENERIRDSLNYARTIQTGSEKLYVENCMLKNNIFSKDDNNDK